MCCCMTILVGCGDDEETHNHTYSTAWSFNQNEHWHTATCEHKSELSEKAEHIFNGNICSVCNYDKSNPQVDTSTEYSITFNANNGTFSQGTTIKKVANGNALLIAPTEPTRSGYAFAGWARQANGENLWNFSEDRVSQDMTLYARWLQIFNVNYDANGGNFTNGSTIFEIDVKFGDKLEIPSPPSRENYKFTRWYKDSALTQEWLFDEDVVCSEFTLYAGWESTIIEQEVTYNLNYDGQECLKMSTEEGRVTLVPTRQGYVFNGWWISDGQTEDGTFILVQKWDTAEIVTVSDLVLYAEWVEESTVSSQLPAPSVNIDGETFSWDTIEGAVRYDVRVYEIGSNEELTSATVNGTSWTFPNGYDAGYYTVKVRAIGDGINTVNSVYVSKNYGHHILSAISKIEFDITTSVLTWSPVRNATSYELYVNNILVDTFTYTTYDFSNYEAGVYQVKIVALRNEYQSSTTSQTIEKLRLKTPKVQLYIDKGTNDYVLMWNSVAHADTYTLNFNGIEIKIEDATFYRFDNSANFWDDANSVTITMTAFDSTADYLVSLSTDELSTNKVYVLSLDKNATNAGSVSTKGEVYIEKTFTVNFDLNGSSGSVASQVISSEKGITYPSTIPTRDGYVFSGWYTTPNCTDLYDFSAEVKTDTTLYAGWYAINTTGYGNYVLDIISNYNSSSRAYAVSTSSTSSSNAKYMYFRALTGGTYTLYYKNSSSSSNYGTYLYVYNVSQGKTLTSNTKVTSTSYNSVTLNLAAGDVIYIRNYAYTYGATFYFYITGAKKPIDGGLVTNKYLIEGVTDSQNFDSTVYVESNKSITLTAETTDNRYTFEGWYNGDTKVSSESSYTFSMPNENVTYTAKWIYYTLSLNKSIDEAGSITNANSQVIKVGDEVTITAITNSGYTWVGWYNGKTKLTDELSYTFLMPAENVNYVAKWIACPVTLEKNINEAGSISGLPETTKVGEEITITAETNNGYTWIGWYDGDTRLTSELSYTFTVPSRNVTYTAKWITFPVSFEKSIDEAGSISGLPETTKVGDKITINASTNAGYTWVGWYNGNTKVCDDLSFTFSVPAESVNYVAKWITCPVTLGKSMDEAGSISGLPETTKVGDNVTVTATTNNGYTWVGWYNGDTKICDKLSYTFAISTEDVTYTAKWIKITLTQDSSLAGTISSLNESYIVGDEVTITASTNEGYTWDGWYKGTVKLTNDISYTFNMPSENTTYTAKWIANAFEITLNAQGGTLENSSKVTIKMGEISTLEVPTKTGYYFGGWYTIDKVKIADTEGNMLSHWNMADDAELVAQWLRPLVFNENGGGAVDTQYVEPGTIVTLPTTTKTGHTFNGWTYNSSTYTGSFTMPDTEVTMDAKWTANTYYIYYNGTSLKVTYGQYYSIPTPTKTGYTFRYFTKSGSTTRFSSSGYYNTTGNTSLSCKWVKDLSTTVSGAKTISVSKDYLENGMTFTITYSGSTMKCFKIETNAPVNVVFVGTGYSYSNDTSCGVNSHGGSTTMTIKITIPDISKISGTFTCKFTCTTYIQSGDGI